MEKVKIPASPQSLITKTDKKGPTYNDTVTFDDSIELQNFGENLLQFRLIKIRMWYGRFTPTHVVNGLQLTYKNLDSGKIYETSTRYGDHQLIGYTDFDLSENELIHKVEIRIGHIVDQVKFYTTKNRVIFKGGEVEYAREYSMKDKVVVGTYGGFGGHLHNFGLYVAPIEDVKYWKRRSYLLMASAIEKDQDLKDKVINLIQGKRLEKSQWPEAAFVMLVMCGRQLFVSILKWM